MRLFTILNTRPNTVCQLNVDNDKLRGTRILGIEVHASELIYLFLVLLKPSDTANYDSDRKVPINTCTEGTRAQLLADIFKWATSDDPESGVALINGMAGLGKSTIAATIVATLMARPDLRDRLGATFFFSRREGAELRSAHSVLRTLAYQFASRHSSFREQILAPPTDDRPAEWTSVPLNVQLKRFYGALQATSFTHPPLIVLDAFDECEWPGSRDLLALLLGMAFPYSGTICPLRILVTSRPETGLVSLFDEYCHGQLGQGRNYILHEIDPVIARHDIRLYLESSLLQVPRALNLYDLPSPWFTESQLDQLTEAAGSFFIYAATAIRIIEDRELLDPETQLETLVTPNGATSMQYSALDNLYLSILLPIMTCANPEFAIGRYRVIVGSLVLLKTELPLLALANLLDVTSRAVSATLSRLQSIIIVPSDPTKPATVYHASFIDFVTSGRCSEQRLRLTLEGGERHLAMRCLTHMIQTLRENMAEIPDSVCKLSEMPDLVDRISPEMRYSVRYWASHLQEAPFNDGELIKLIETFASKCLLWWIELCAVIGCLDTAITACQHTITWLVSDFGSIAGYCLII